MEKNSIYKVSKKIIIYLNETRENPSTKAILANLRNSSNRPIGENIESLAFIFSMVPEEELGISYKLNSFEVTLLTVLQLYALYQQGKDEQVIFNEEGQSKSFGMSLKSIKTSEKDESNSTDLRFNALISASDFNELKNHLRQLIKILRSKTDDKVDFPTLAKDLYEYNKYNSKDSIRIKWARDYYRSSKNENNKGENDEK